MVNNKLSKVIVVLFVTLAFCITGICGAVLIKKSISDTSESIEVAKFNSSIKSKTEEVIYHFAYDELKKNMY
ncbi:hypothetical protein NST55_29370 [Bacillus sp. FSL R10-2789]|uniref:hypothetical protein n=1 Tax=Bacillus sp. FSL R10-2789 TaxID=2954662 RepID=UPI0030F91C84